MRPIGCHFIVPVLCLCACLALFLQGRAVAAEPNLITGSVQNQDLRRVGQVLIEVKNQEGTLVTTGVSNSAGEFSIPVPADETYSVSAVQEIGRAHV